MKKLLLVMLAVMALSSCQRYHAVVKMTWYSNNGVALDSCLYNCYNLTERQVHKGYHLGNEVPMYTKNAGWLYEGGLTKYTYVIYPQAGRRKRGAED